MITTRFLNLKNNLKKIIFIFFIHLLIFHCKNTKGKNIIIPLMRSNTETVSSSSSQTQKPEKKPLIIIKDLLEYKIQKTILLEHIVKNQVSKTDYKKVDFSISGDFIEDLTNFKQVSLTYQVFADNKNLRPKKITVTPEFIKKKKIPLFLDLSALQPDRTAVSSKLKLIFDIDEHKIEYTENFYLLGKKQEILFTDLKDQEIEELLYNATATLKVKIKGQSSPGIRLETVFEDVSGDDDNGDFSPIELSVKDKISKQEFHFPLDTNKRYLVKARTYFRINEASENWQAIGDTVYRSYSLYNPPADFRLKTNKTLLISKGGEVEFTLTKMRRTNAGGADDSIMFYWEKDENIFYGGGSVLGMIEPGSDYIDEGKYVQARPYFNNITCRNSCVPVNPNKIPEGYTFALTGIKRSFNVNFKISARDNLVIKILVRP